MGGFALNAGEVVDQYASTMVVDDLRAERANGNDEGGDMLFENTVLFMRDSLILREFTDAIKAGDGGRVVMVIKIWTHMFRGGGKNKYAQEAMEFIHNFTCVWSEADRCAFESI